MAIMVQYGNNSYGYVQNRELDGLISDGAIVAFRRSDGWAEIGKDAIRVNVVGGSYSGADRRGFVAGMNCLTCTHFVNSLCQSKSCPSRLSMQGKSSAAEKRPAEA